MSAAAFQAITALRDQFAMTLVITPPGLSHPIVHRLASLVDATILVLHAEKTRPAVADRFRDVTLEAGGNLAGFIFVGRRFYVPRWLYRRL
jgi:predicted phosphoribosyltransferase